MVGRAQRDAVRLLRYQPGAVFWLAISQIYSLGVRGLAMGIAAMTSWGFRLLVALTFPLLVEALGAASTFWIYRGSERRDPGVLAPLCSGEEGVVARGDHCRLVSLSLTARTALHAKGCARILGDRVPLEDVIEVVLHVQYVIFDQESERHWLALADDALAPHQVLRQVLDQTRQQQVVVLPEIDQVAEFFLLRPRPGRRLSARVALRDGFEEDSLAIDRLLKRLCKVFWHELL